MVMKYTLKRTSIPCVACVLLLIVARQFVSPPTFIRNREMMTASLRINECAVNLETHLQPLQRQWDLEDMPILHDLIVVDDVYHAIFNIDGRVGDGNWDHYKDYSENHLWWCDGDPSGEVVTPHDKSWHTIIIKCNNVQHEIVATPIDGLSQDGKRVAYNVEANLECINSGPISFPSATKYASCTAIRGEDNRKLLPQWIEYHKLIGFQHFFVYVNEPLNKAADLYSKPYVTYIPFDYEPKHDFYFQATWQNDCIYRAKNATVNWVGVHDIDEYFEPLQEPYQISAVLDKYADSQFAGIKAFNHWWGPHPEDTDFHNKAEILMDYTWRAPGPGGPGKNIVIPERIHYYYVHWVTSTVDGSYLFTYDILNYIRLNHFRRPYTGVHDFDTLEKISSLVNDESFRDRFSDRVKAAIGMTSNQAEIE